MTPQTPLAMAAALVTFALGFWVGSAWQNAETHAAHAALADAQIKWEKQRTEAQAQYAASILQARSQEQAWRAAAQKAEIKNATEERRHRNERTALDRTAHQLRQQLATVRRRLSDPAAPTAPALATALADVHQHCADRYVQLAQEADRCGAELMRIWSQWPAPDH